MASSAKERPGEVGANGLIEHMKFSVGPAAVSAGGGRSGYSRIGSGVGVAVPSPNSTAAISSSTAAQQTRENLERALRMNETTNSSGYATLQSLGKQREVIQNTLNTVGATQQHLSDSRQVIHDIRMGVYREWLIKAGVIAFLVLLLCVIIYSKFVR